MSTTSDGGLVEVRHLAANLIRCPSLNPDKKSISLARYERIDMIFHNIERIRDCCTGL